MADLEVQPTFGKTDCCQFSVAHYFEKNGKTSTTDFWKNVNVRVLATISFSCNRKLRLSAWELLSSLHGVLDGVQQFPVNVWHHLCVR